MGDILLQLSQNSITRKLVRHLKLPVPLPPMLPRQHTAWGTRPLEKMTVVLGHPEALQLPQTLAETLIQAGALVRTPANLIDSQTNSAQAELVQALVFDASGILDVQQLDEVYRFYHLHLPRLQAGGRVLVLAPTPDPKQPVLRNTAAEALQGFIKSLAKEIGRRGATAQLLSLPMPDSVTAIAKLEAASIYQAAAGSLIFLLSKRSAFISGQRLELNSELMMPASVALTLKNSLTDKVALVTGAAQGIGAAIATVLAREGAKVIGVDRPAEADRLEAHMQAIGGLAYVQDLGEPQAIDKLCQRLRTEVGALDILVNNAGITRDKTLARMSDSQWSQVLHLNLHVPQALTAAVCGLTNSSSTSASLMRDAGRIIFLSSIGGLAGNAGQTNYAAAKAGLLGLTRTWAPPLAKRGITINAIAPGFIETAMTSKMPVALREVGRRFNALNQGGLPSDVAELTMFLASPSAAAISGGVIRVCGLNFLG